MFKFNKPNPDYPIKPVLTIVLGASISAGLSFLYGYALVGIVLVLGAAAALGTFCWEWKEIHDPKAAAKITSTGPHPQYVSFSRFSTVTAVFGIAMVLALVASGLYLTGALCAVVAAATIAAMGKDGMGGGGGKKAWKKI